MVGFFSSGIKKKTGEGLTFQIQPQSLRQQMCGISFYSNATIKIRGKNGEAKTIGRLIAKQLIELQRAEPIHFS